VTEKVIRSKLKFKNEIEDDTSKSQSGLACIPAPYKKLRQTMPQKKAAEAVGVARTTAETWDTKLKMMQVMTNSSFLAFKRRSHRFPMAA